MSYDGYPLYQDYDIFSTTVNDIFVWIFTAEMILKLIALDPYNYFQEGWNIFDFIIVWVSLLEKMLEDLPSVSVLRAFRAVRIFKLAKSWETLNKLIRIIGETVPSLINLTLVLALVLFIFSIVGMQILGPNYQAHIDQTRLEMGEQYQYLEQPRWHLADFKHSFLAGFRILCGEWLEMMYECLEWAEHDTFSGVVCVPLFIFALVVGNLIILNLFLALLMSGFSSDTLRTDTEELDQQNSFTASMARLRRWKNAVISFFTCYTKTGKKVTDINNNFEKSEPEQTKKLLASKTSSNTSAGTDTALKKSTSSSKHDDIPRGCISQLFYEYICSQKWFTGFILVVVLISSAQLGFEDVYMKNLTENARARTILYITDKIYTIIFILEMIVKIIGLTPKKYFTSAWCILDFVIVVSSIVNLVAEYLQATQLTMIKSIRMLRVLRPARAISRIEGTKIIMMALVRAIPSFANVALVCMIVWVIFSIIGVSLFAGKFQKCVWTSNMTMIPSVYQYQDFENYLTDNGRQEFNTYRWKQVTSFLSSRSKAITDLNIRFYDGSVMTQDYIFQSYLDYREGHLILPQIDSKNKTIRLPQWGISRDSCLALGEMSIFMNCMSSVHFWVVFSRTSPDIPEHPRTCKKN